LSNNLKPSGAEKHHPKEKINHALFDFAISSLLARRLPTITAETLLCIEFHNNSRNKYGTNY
jgi:hypothetical protein